ncbi:amino acid adenylation domain-containing protein [Komagataeibacter nataicola]|uniref:amino acid adenylation domain-containing protein n=1 Tax=Komagataeibacter nataicola TaxID=265960 RepID=UPI0023DD174A|nr:amino acid adenylation domain-containing protein [Komagataeibacter nataicola]WEQ54972.1 amino acid adenylation domain-containing protein [Komagataeibacter nataicola]
MNHQSPVLDNQPDLSGTQIDHQTKKGSKTGELIDLSSAQREMWLAALLDPKQIYNIAGYVEILEHIDIDIFQESCGTLTKEAETLRSKFYDDGNNVTQSFSDCVDLSYRYIDLSDNVNPVDAALHFMEKESYVPINPLADNIYSFILIRIQSSHFIFYQKYHHLISDGLSVALMLERLTEIYRSRIMNVEPDSKWFGSAKDYLIFNRIYEESDTQKNGRIFWKKYLDKWDYPGSTLELLPSGDYLAGRQMSVALPADDRRVFAKIIERAQCQFSTFSIAYAAIVVARITGQCDIVLSLPVTGRSRISRKTPAFQSNILPLRISITPETTLDELLGVVSRETRRILRYSRVRGEQIARDILPRGTRSFGPCVNILDFNSNLLFSKRPSRYKNICLGPVWDLSISFYKDPSAELSDFSILVERPPGLREAADLSFLATRMQWIGEQIARQPEVKIDDLEIIRPEERTLVLETWNDTATPWPQDLCLHQMVEAQVLRTPDAPAVICEDTCLSYAELNTRANRLAHHLVALGVTPDSPVAICLDRSAEMVVGLLAILKAGGAYLPLDPAYPSSRLAQILDDAKPAIILLDRTGHSVIGQKLTDIPIRIDVLADTHMWAQCPSANLEPAQLGLGAHNTAYIIYTSGSTGTPKGVPNGHRAVANRLLWMQNAYGMTTADAVVQKTPFGFDVSVWEFFWPLLAGARLVMAKPDGHKDPEYLASLILSEQITTIHFVPSMLELFLDSEKMVEEGALRTLICSGEALPLEVLKRCRSLLPEVAVHNLYGPTEAAIDVTAWSCPDDISALVTVPIGRPIANTRIYLLDGQGEPVPPGVAGELYIGGAGVARGYLNRPDLTAERFLDDPFARTPGARMYRTGDLARYRPDGNIEFLGRADQQVKIRGFRIEPGEIEARLTECSGVRTAAVIAREDIPGDRRLVGYVVPEPDATPDPATLRRALAAVLPDYMVPAALVLLDALPLTPNGKLDRKALPAPDFTPAGEGRAPRNPQEAILAALFAEVLGLTRVGIDDSFFDLGGHSLLATRLASRIRSSLNIDLPVRAVFENPTVAGLAEATAGQEDSNRPPLVPMTRPAILPLSFAQQRLWFLFRLEGPSATYNMPLSIQMDGPLSIAAMQTALGDVVARHESLRTVFPEVDGIACQQVLATEDPRCTVLLDHRHVAGHDLDRTLAAIAATPIDIANELPLRAFVLEVTPVRHVLVVLVHHIAADGWSMAPFARDLAQAYDARTAGTQPAFTPLPVQYADYTLWQRTLLGNADDPDSLYAQQADYWQTTLAGLPECITLPTDRPRPAVSAYQGATVPLIIPPPRTRRTPRCPGKGLGNQRLHDPSSRARRVAGQTRSRG